MSTIQKVFEFLIDHYHNGNKSDALKAYAISRTQLHGILSGEQSNPSFKTLVKIIEVHPEIDANWILTGDGSPQKLAVPVELEKLREENKQMRDDIRAILNTQKKYL